MPCLPEDSNSDRGSISSLSNTKKKSLNNTKIHMSGHVRAPSDPCHKHMMNARAKISRALESNLPTLAEARSCEREIYRRSHSNLDTYRHTAEGVVLRVKRNDPPFAPPRDIVMPKSTAVTQQKLRGMFRVQHLDDIVTADARYALARCRVCRSQEIEVVTAQLRSGDEGMSVIANCQRCGHRWTQR